MYFNNLSAVVLYIEHNFAHNAAYKSRIKRTKEREMRMNNDDRLPLRNVWFFRQNFCAAIRKEEEQSSLGWGLMTTAINYHRDCTVHVYLFSVRATWATRKRITQLANFHWYIHTAIERCRVSKLDSFIVSCRDYVNVNPDNIWIDSRFMIARNKSMTKQNDDTYVLSVSFFFEE